MITIKSFPSSSFEYYVPEYATTNNGTTVYRKSHVIPVSGPTLDWEFELPEDRWFCYEKGRIVRFKKAQEDEYRLSVAKQLSEMATTLEPDKALKLYENAAHLIYVTLPELVAFLKSNAQSNESLADAFSRLKNQAFKKMKDDGTNKT